jgi:hypothetical protein
LARRFSLSDGELRGRLKQLRQASSARPVRRSDDVAERRLPAPCVREMDARELELLEILVIHHEYVEQAIAEIEVGLLRSAPARQIFHTIHRLYDDQHTPDFGNVLSALDEPEMKNIWVEIDERAQAKAAEVQEDARERLQGLIDGYRYAREVKDRRHKYSALQEKQLNEEEELYALQKLIAQERDRQGISKPKDG